MPCRSLVLCSPGGPSPEYLCRRLGDLPGSWGTPLASVPRSPTPASQPFLTIAVGLVLSSEYDTSSTFATLFFRGSITRPTCSLSTLHSLGHPKTAQDSLPACWLNFSRVGIAPTGFQSRISKRHSIPPFPTSQASPGAHHKNIGAITCQAAS